jgi:hypothetical protein
MEASIVIMPRARALAAIAACGLLLALVFGPWVGLACAGAGLAGMGIIARREARRRPAGLSLPS